LDFLPGGRILLMKCLSVSHGTVLSDECDPITVCSTTVPHFLCEETLHKLYTADNCSVLSPVFSTYRIMAFSTVQYSTINSKSVSCTIYSFPSFQWSMIDGAGIFHIGTTHILVAIQYAYQTYPLFSPFWSSLGFIPMMSKSLLHFFHSIWLLKQGRTTVQASALSFF
jgi:hypothetical protein